MDDDPEDPLDKEVTIQIRCTARQRKEWKRVANEIAPFPGENQIDAIERIIEAYDSNPKLFKPSYR